MQAPKENVHDEASLPVGNEIGGEKYLYTISCLKNTCIQLAVHASALFMALGCVYVHRQTTTNYVLRASW